MTALSNIYLIRDSERNHYKIGIAVDVKARLQHLQTANSAKLELICSIPTNEPAVLEKTLHTKFQVQKVMNEWFKLTNDDIAYIKSLAVKEQESLSADSFDNYIANKPLDRKTASKLNKIKEVFNS